MNMPYHKIKAAAEALTPMMGARGLTGRTQIMLTRLWRELTAHMQTLAEADAALARAHGTLRTDGVIDFKDDANRAEFLAQRGEMLAAETEVHPVRIKPEKALFAVSTPEQWAALDGFIQIEGSEEA